MLFFENSARRENGGSGLAGLMRPIYIIYLSVVLYITKRKEGGGAGERKMWCEMRGGR